RCQAAPLCRNELTAFEAAENWLRLITLQRIHLVTPAGRDAARQPAAVPDRHGGLRGRASSQSQAADAWSRRPADAGEIRNMRGERTSLRVARMPGNSARRKHSPCRTATPRSNRKARI